MEVRQCSRCGESRPISEFPLRRLGANARQPHCRACKAAYQRDWYRRNRDRHMQEVERHRQRRIAANRDIVRVAKSVPCADCGLRYPTYVMDFDHRDGKKLGNVSEMVRHVSPDTLRQEIAKCAVVCANCHRHRTHGCSRRPD